jgi:hypothetical protein
VEYLKEKTIPHVSNGVFRDIVNMMSIDGKVKIKIPAGLTEKEKMDRAEVVNVSFINYI